MFAGFFAVLIKVIISNNKYHLHRISTDPESFFKGWGVQNLDITFYRGERGAVPIFSVGHHQPTSQTSFQWRFASGPMIV